MHVHEDGSKLEKMQFPDFKKETHNISKIQKKKTLMLQNNIILQKNLHSSPYKGY